MEASDTLDILWPGAACAMGPLAAQALRSHGGRARVAVASRARAAPDAGAPADPGKGQVRLAELISRMAGRDEAALAAFCDATIARVYGLALRIVRCAAEAEQVAVDTLHQAWCDAPRFDGARGTPLAWLLMMCRSRALDLVRRRDPAILHEDPHSLRAGDDARTNDFDPQDLVSAMQSRTALAAAVARLAPGQRQMLSLAFFRGLSHEEIALHTALPLGTVKSQIRRALATLRIDLVDHEGASR